MDVVRQTRYALRSVPAAPAIGVPARDASGDDGQSVVSDTPRRAISAMRGQPTDRWAHLDAAARPGALRALAHGDDALSLRLLRRKRTSVVTLSWAKEAIAQDHVACVDALRTVLTRPRIREALARPIRHDVSRGRLRQAAQAVDDTHLMRAAQASYLPDIAAFVCARRGIAGENIGAMYATDFDVIIEALQTRRLRVEIYKRMRQCDDTRIVAALCAGNLDYRVGVAALRDVSFHKMQTLVAHRRASWANILIEVPLRAEVVREGVACGVFGIQHVSTAGLNKAALLNALYEASAISAKDAVRYGLLVWSASEPLPEYTRAFIRTFATPEDLIVALKPPTVWYTQSCQNRHYALRAVAQWHVDHGDGPSRGEATLGPNTLSASAQRGHAGAHNIDGPHIGACIACLEPFGETLTPANLTGCRHPPTMDAACLERGLVAHGMSRCPDTQCNRRLTPCELLALGKSVERADAAAWAIVHDAHSTDTLWHFCTTSQCPSGIQVSEKDTVHFDCPCCGQVSRFGGARWDASSLGRLDPAQKVYLKTLIWSTYAAPPEGARKGPIRECYHCGTPTQLTDGCNTIDCTQCRREWDFRHGDRVDHDFHRRPQMYVPKRGWLVDLGLYYGAGLKAPQMAHDIIRRNMGDADYACVMRTKSP